MPRVGISRQLATRIQQNLAEKQSNRELVGYLWLRTGKGDVKVGYHTHPTPCPPVPHGALCGFGPPSVTDLRSFVGGHIGDVHLVFAHEETYLLARDSSKTCSRQDFRRALAKIEQAQAAVRNHEMPHSRYVRTYIAILKRDFPCVRVLRLGAITKRGSKSQGRRAARSTQKEPTRAPRRAKRARQRG